MATVFVKLTITFHNINLSPGFEGKQRVWLKAILNRFKSFGNLLLVVENHLPIIELAMYVCMYHMC